MPVGIESQRHRVAAQDPRAGEQLQLGRAYRIDAEAGLYTLMERKDGGDWTPQYRFGLQPYRYPDYAEMCHYHQTSLESHFTQRRVCSRATPDGRLTLSEKRFIETTLSGDRHERVLRSEEEVSTVLRESFGIVMADAVGPRSPQNQ